MICTAMINGSFITINGEPEECAEFFREVYTPSEFAGKGIAEMLRDMKPKVCNPFAAHYGSCGAENCPIGPNGKMKESE